MSEEKICQKITFAKSEILSVLYIPLTLIYLELGLRIKCELDLSLFILPNLILWITLGLVFSGILLLIKKNLLRKILGGTTVLLLCLYYTVEAFIQGSYKVFMTLDSVIKGTGGVLSDFSDELFAAITGGFLFIAAMFLPAVLFFVLIFKKWDFNVYAQNKTVVLITVFVIVFVLNIIGAKIVLSTPNMLGAYRNAYNFDNAVFSFGLSTGTRLDLQYNLLGNPYTDNIVIEEPVIPEEPETPEEIPEDPEEEPILEYAYNVTEIDFDSLISKTNDNSLINIHRYISSLEPTKQNEFTGLFEGKNLILITAESFAKELIDPVLTPTLYRLYSNGFTFTDYYQPSWGGSTTTGEYSIFTGLVAHHGVDSMHKFVKTNTSFTIGNRLRELGYSSFAYHNGYYDYYGRNKTHEQLGYNSFIGIGNGMENGIKTGIWPASDLQMMEFTVSDFIDKQPFSAYYMTISGHGSYANFWHTMAVWNREAVKNLPYSETVQAYFAANLEFEYAMAYLVEQLEAAGIADDTVIIISSDHYPYALEKGEAWNNEIDFLPELYGHPVENAMDKDHNALIIWSGCLENEHKDLAITVESPSYSLDILPTLCNLFGLEYDSRLFVGRDLLSDYSALVLWPNYNWKTELGFYDFTKDEFIPTNGGERPDQEYIDHINTVVKNKIAYSKAVITYDYFNIIFEENS